MRQRHFPHPLMFIILFVLWLLLSQSLALTSMLMAFGVSYFLCHLLHRLEPPVMRLKRPVTMLRLILIVIIDIARSNINVARLLLSPEPLDPPSGFVTIPLGLTHPQGLAFLACIITSTPGTVWVTHNPERQYFIIHVLDVRDESAIIEEIKRRYEQPLIEIFQ